MFVRYTREEIQELLDVAKKRTQPELTGIKAKLYEICKYVKFFRGIEYEDVLEITKDVTFAKYERGEMIITEGEVDDRLFYIIKGEIAVLKKVNQLQRKQIAFLGEGHIFGEVALLQDGKRGASISVTKSATVILHFKLDKAKLKSHAPAFAIFYENIAKDLAIKLEESNKRFLN